MPRALAEHAVEAKPDEESNQSENDNDGQFWILCVSSANIVRLR
jgi:hypothetical protein